MNVNMIFSLTNNARNILLTYFHPQLVMVQLLCVCVAEMQADLMQYWDLKTEENIHSSHKKVKAYETSYATVIIHCGWLAMNNCIMNYDKQGCRVMPCSSFNMRAGMFKRPSNSGCMHIYLLKSETVF